MSDTLRSANGRVRLSAMLFASLTVCTTTASAGDMPAPHLIGEFIIPSGLRIGGEVFGGISGLDFDPRSGTYLAISDDRAENASARFYRLAIDIKEDGVPGLEVLETQHLKAPDGSVFAVKTLDPESIRLDASTDTILWSSERDASGAPHIYRSDLTGGNTVEIAVPDYYAPNADNTRGVYSNLAFEGLTISADGKQAIFATENALAQDGGKATLSAGSLSRIGVIDLESGKLTAEYAYLTDPITIQAVQDPFWNDNGVSEILALDASRIAVVERSFGLGAGNHIRVYVVSLDGATEISGQEKIDPAQVVPLAKQLWFEIREGSFGGIDVDNIEAITKGPEIGGHPTLVLASDDNFNPATQFSQFIVFGY